MATQTEFTPTPMMHSDAVKTGAPREQPCLHPHPHPHPHPHEACVYCGDPSHQITDCTPFQQLDGNDRYLFWTRARCCYNCGDSKHERGDCRKPKCRCGKCGGPHHTALHRDAPLDPRLRTTTLGEHLPANVAATATSATDSTTPTPAKRPTPAPRAHPSGAIAKDSQKGATASTPLASRDLNVDQPLQASM